MRGAQHVSCAAHAPCCVLHVRADADGKLPSAGTSSDVDGTCSQVAVASHDGAIIYAGTRGAVMVLRRSDLALLDVIKVLAVVARPVPAATRHLLACQGSPC